MLRDRGFTKFIIDNEDPTVSVKMLSYVMAHSVLKPQRLLVDHEDYYVAIDLFTNTYYMCYRDLMMIDIDRYKSTDETSVDTLEDIKLKLSKHPELFFRIYSSRNGYHVFVINKSMNYKSNESIQLMSELGCDFYYMVYSYLRGWSVRLNKKKGEENTDVLYTWVGDVVRGHFFCPSMLNLFSGEDQECDVSPDLFGVQLEPPINDSDTKRSTVDAEHSTTKTEHSTVDAEHSTTKTEHSTVDAEHSTVDAEHSTTNTEHSAVDAEHSTVTVDINSIMPDARLEMLAQLHITLVDVFKHVGLCTMPAP